MKKFYFLLLGLFLFSGLNAQIINIPDANFKAKLLQANTSNDIAGYIKIDSNNNGEIEINEATTVLSLNIANSSISELFGIGYFTNLQYLDCSFNQGISYLYLSSLNLSILQISGLTNLISLNCPYNHLESLDLDGLTNLTDIWCDQNQLTSINVSGLTNLTKLWCNQNQLTSLNVSGLTNLKELNCSYNQLATLNVSGLTNLNSLICNVNQLPALNVSGLTNLKYLECGINHLPTLNLSGLVNLEFLNCSGNLLPLLDVSASTNLKTLYCGANQLPALNLSGLTDLIHLSCAGNQLPTLNLSGLTNLKDLQCYQNLLSSLDLSELVNIENLSCHGNQLSSLDVSGLSNLKHLFCSNNLLTSLFIKNGSDEINLDFSNNPTLQYICADENQLTSVQNKITQYSYTNCFVNSYCSFVPGGTYYTIQGNNKYDSNNNGCEVSDIAASNLKFAITDGTVTGSTISNETGAYSIPVVAGTHTITPAFENPTYFNISPSTVNVTFPTQASPFIQDFCVTANGVHPDLEVTILPIVGARPGFDAKYKIIYKNKGNQTQSGSVNLAFNDAVLDLVVANPVVSSQTANNLSWDFVNLLPFETREISVTLNVNSPTETPAVVGGYVLNYTATATSSVTDETPNDNTFAYNQTVVNAFDPNDKTCLEGATIAPAKVGDYVHYMIRFENNGTANAQNIVVKDMIDLAKFDITSIVPIKGSHSFVTNITSGNKVEFIFENINLPFDNANNDGYVAFKIKTKPTLVLGNTFSNSASIYFDYNFPIVTNPATTTIAVLATQDFVFSNYFSLYPNPVKDVLNIAVKETIEITSINIYNTLGQLVLVIPNAQKVSSVDVSGLTAGNYFIKINSDKGTSNTKFIKS
jgi:Leucine-rich repeat (LRR) protein